MNLIEIASELAHNRTLYESSDICNNEDDMYEYPNSEELKYKEEIQDRFNNWYDYYLSSLSKYHKDNTETINRLINSCQEGLSGEWDCSSNEGKEGFQAMINDLETLKIIK